MRNSETATHFEQINLPERCVPSSLTPSMESFPPCAQPHVLRHLTVIADSRRTVATVAAAITALQEDRQQCGCGAQDACGGSNAKGSRSPSITSAPVLAQEHADSSSDASAATSFT